MYNTKNKQIYLNKVQITNEQNITKIQYTKRQDKKKQEQYRHKTELSIRRNIKDF